MFCSKCGCKNPEGSFFCNNCGANVAEIQSPDNLKSPNSGNPSILRYGAGLASVIIIGIIITYWVLYYRPLSFFSTANRNTYTEPIISNDIQTNNVANQSTTQTPQLTNEVDTAKQDTKTEAQKSSNITMTQSGSAPTSGTVKNQEMLNSMLLVAAKNGDVSEVTRLLSSGAYVDSTDPRTNESALILAIEYGKVGVVKTLLLQGANPNHRAMGNSQPLMFAAMCRYDGDNMEIIQYLIAAGANINNQNDLGSTALIEACRFGYRNKAWALLSANADKHLVNKAGETAMSVAATNGYSGIVSMLNNFR